jgi:hypothetical protein
VKKAKPELRIVQHRTLGSGVLRFVRVLDSGEFAARVEFGDGVERVLLLDEQWWITPIAEMLTAQPEPARKYKPEPKPAQPDADDDEAAELEVSDGHIFGDTETEDGAHEHDADEVESETESEELVGADA